jgi:4-amino-4-deoxy-L-arabinose transferase-like glycosyltransferase
MDVSPQTNSKSSERFLYRSDVLFLLAVTVCLYGYSLIHHRVLTTHETTHCINVVEMFNNGAWWIPTYGGRPWLERPPLPHWITGTIAVVAADVYQEWALRLGSILVGCLTVLVFSWAVTSALGRGIGVMSGAILATAREFAAYSTGPEADIFLAAIVTITGAFFIRMEFGPVRPEAQEQRGFFGNRPWYVWAFFTGMGLTNMAKGPMFGASFLISALGIYYLWTRDFGSIKRYIWLWGWLIFAGISAIWPLISYTHFPDVVDLWASDYFGRMNTSYMQEPWWYYFAHQPWNLFPWSICVFVGLAMTWRNVKTSGAGVERWIWCWALVPVLVFSYFRGKHHHYMLNCMAPWAVLAAYGCIGVWQFVQTTPKWWRSSWMSVAVLGIPGVILLLIFGGKIPGPEYVRWIVTISWPIYAFAAWWLIANPRSRVAFGGVCALVVLVNCLAYAHRTAFLDRYTDDSNFMREVREQVQADQPIWVLVDNNPLDASWRLFYLGPRSKLLHNASFLRSDRIDAPEVYVVCRKSDEESLKEFGTVEQLNQSRKSRGEESIKDRFTLYKLRFDPHLERVHDERISPMQATGRKRGPYLKPPRHTASASASGGR